MAAGAESPLWCNRAARAAGIDRRAWSPPAATHPLALSGGRSAWVWPSPGVDASLEDMRAQLHEFTYAASHDLQAPARTVAAYLDLLVADCGPSLSEDAREYVGFALQGAHRIRELLAGLLAWSRVTTHGRALVPTSANDAFDLAVLQVRASVAPGDEVSRGDLPEVVADPGQLLDLFARLLDNALKFRGSGPAQVVVDARRDADRWLFEVRDRGIGMDPRFHDRVLRMFQRLHSEEAYPGCGAGLAVCLRIVERHGGRLWLQSTPDAGTTCTFTLTAVQD